MFTKKGDNMNYIDKLNDHLHNDYTKKLYTFKLGSVIFLNPENVLKPTDFLFTTGCILTSNHSVLNLDFDYGIKNQFTKHDFSSKTSVRAFNKDTPFAVGLDLRSNCTIDLNAQRKFKIF